MESFFYVIMGPDSKLRKVEIKKWDKVLQATNKTNNTSMSTTACEGVACCLIVHSFIFQVGYFAFVIQQLFLKGFNDMVTTNTAADEGTSVLAAIDHWLAPGHTAHPHVLDPTHAPATCIIKKNCQPYFGNHAGILSFSICAPCYVDLDDVPFMHALSRTPLCDIQTQAQAF